MVSVEKRFTLNYVDRITAFDYICRAKRFVTTKINVYSIEIASRAQAHVSDRFVLYGVGVCPDRIVACRLVQEESVCTQGGFICDVTMNRTFSRENNFTGRTRCFFPIIYRTYQD